MNRLNNLGALWLRSWEEANPAAVGQRRRHGSLKRGALEALVSARTGKPAPEKKK